MRELVILAALVSALHAASLHKDSDVGYKCQVDQDKNVTLAAERFINEHHRHGYKFKFVSLDSRSAEKKMDPCEVILGMTLEETECHIASPKPLDQCTTRSEDQTKVTAKCNVTVSSFKGKAAVKRYICDTEAASHKILVTKCPDCPSLLPLHDPRGLESVQTALQKFNKESSHSSYFKLLEVGRISTQWMSFGQSFFAEFAIMETNCSKEEASQSPEACKALCGDQARYGFCESSKVGTPVQGVQRVDVECKVYEAQNLTHPMQHPTHSKRDCKFHGPPPHPHRPGHAGQKEKTPDQRGRPEHAGHDHKEKTPDQRGRPEHGGHDHKEKTPDQRGRPEHAGHDHKDKTPGQRGRPEHGGHDHKDKTPDQRGRPEHAGHDHKDKTPGQSGRPEHTHCSKGSSGFPESQEHHEFPCHGFVKIPPTVYPICPFPPPRICLGPPDRVPRPSIPPPPPQKLAL
ncbi:alpha-2-HS-glycoprotein 1 [Siphateles boraxobius]|uniref:alpha-2-HS-glycoprotein 1 n=1 Tax=Siphateles boraxobius TaxID=180520 RepID=UPI004064C4C6